MHDTNVKTKVKSLLRPMQLSGSTSYALNYPDGCVGADIFEDGNSVSKHVAVF